MQFSPPGGKQVAQNTKLQLIYNLYGVLALIWQFFVTEKIILLLFVII